MRRGLGLYSFILAFEIPRITYWIVSSANAVFAAGLIVGFAGLRNEISKSFLVGGIVICVVLFAIEIFRSFRFESRRAFDRLLPHALSAGVKCLWSTFAFLMLRGIFYSDVFAPGPRSLHIALFSWLFLANAPSLPLDIALCIPKGRSKLLALYDDARARLEEMKGRGTEESVSDI